VGDDLFQAKLKGNDLSNNKDIAWTQVGDDLFQAKLKGNDLSNDYKNYNSGHVLSWQDWIGKYANCSFDYFARHNSGRPINYKFNNSGYRGSEHHDNPDISVFGSSFSFGVGIEFSDCWHQLLGDYRVNCYAPAGILITNNDIIDHYQHTNITSGIVILQLREFKYNTLPIVIPNNVKCFVIDENEHGELFGFDYASFVDKAEDNTHPGPETHKQWATQIKKKFSL
jgi:hypothetical protein